MEVKFKTINDFKNEMVTNHKLQEEFKKDPIAAANMIEQQNPLATDAWIYRIVVISLGGAVVLIIIGIVVLMLKGKIADDKAVPTIFTALGSAAIGALAGLLAPSPKENPNR